MSWSTTFAVVSFNVKYQILCCTSIFFTSSHHLRVINLKLFIWKCRSNSLWFTFTMAPITDKYGTSYLLSSNVHPVYHHLRDIWKSNKMLKPDLENSQKRKMESAPFNWQFSSHISDYFRILAIRQHIFANLDTLPHTHAHINALTHASSVWGERDEV